MQRLTFHTHALKAWTDRIGLCARYMYFVWSFISSLNISTVNSKIFAKVFFRETSRSFVKKTPREMALSLCLLLMKVNHVIDANYYVANMSFNAIRENKIIGKISEFTVFSSAKSADPDEMPLQSTCLLLSRHTFSRLCISCHAQVA